MAAHTESTDWLEVEPKQVVVEDDEAWLDVQDPNAGKTTQAFRHLVDACMRGTDRVMACDGHYLAYRPYNHEKDKAVNPAAKERFNNFREAGYYKHIGTYDEVQIYELLEGSPFRHSTDHTVGRDRWKDIRQAATLACERKWAEYHDLLGGVATALKKGRDPNFARQMWEDTLNQVGVTIKQMHGPSEAEVNAGFTGVRKARGISKGGVLATLNTGALQQARFK